MNFGTVYGIISKGTNYFHKEIPVPDSKMHSFYVNNTLKQVGTVSFWNFPVITLSDNNK